MSFVEFIRQQVIDIENALEAARLKRQTLGSEIGKQATQVHSTLALTTSNANNVLRRIEATRQHYLSETCFTTVSSSQCLGTVPQLKKDVRHMATYLLKTIDDMSSTIQSDGDSEAASLLVKMHNYPCYPEPDWENISAYARDFNGIGLKTLQALRSYRLGNVSFPEVDLSSQLGDRSDDVPDFQEAPCAESPGQTFTDHLKAKLRSAWTSVDVFEREGHGRLEDAQKTLNDLRTRCADQEKIFATLSFLVEDIATCLENSMNEPNVNIPPSHASTIIQSFNHTSSLNGLWAMVACMVDGKTQSPSSQTLQCHYDHFQNNKDPNWGFRLTTNESIRYLLDRWNIRYHPPNSRPSQTSHLSPFPWQPPLPLELHSDSCPSQTAVTHDPRENLPRDVASLVHAEQHSASVVEQVTSYQNPSTKEIDLPVTSTSLDYSHTLLNRVEIDATEETFHCSRTDTQPDTYLVTDLSVGARTLLEEFTTSFKRPGSRYPIADINSSHSYSERGLSSLGCSYDSRKDFVSTITNSGKSLPPHAAATKLSDEKSDGDASNVGLSIRGPDIHFTEGDLSFLAVQSDIATNVFPQQQNRRKNTRHVFGDLLVSYRSDLDLGEAQ
ncbi:hypothetical protein C8J55DRAFT_564332 [Lentinula edodes]|uniref:Uncharacterized protein n=1 Tax=Lentinula lateritia TaxID=40482 RepID=A0A9W8ZZD1_9AGAR|nr:hypothetical protein C8J55DRAFT_564332 [Lentinula edodes]